MWDWILDHPLKYTVILIALLCDSAQAIWHETAWNVAWDTWWHYKEGAIGGPSYWGQTAYMAYAEDVWRSCHMGKLQSPISIDSAHLTYDKSLRTLELRGKDKKIDMEIHNVGQDVRIEFLESSPPIILSGGPLSYDYQLFGAVLKFGSDSFRGSDHQIDGFSFPAELQFYAFNFVLYHNISTAVASPNGLAAISIFMKIGEHPSADLSALLATLKDVQLKGQFRRLNGLLLSAMIPSMDQFITYQGSLPFPACHETVTWIVLNQAVIITEYQLKSLRKLRIGPVRESGTMANNFRPIQNLNNRSVRTNINFDEKDSHCSVQPRISYVATVENKLANLNGAL